MERARAVVVGGGITGASVAYHLAKAGWHDVVLLEKDELTSGSTCHAAGLVTQFNPSPTMMRFRRYSIELYQELGVFETVGSLRFASSKDHMMELQRGISRARGIGLDAELISATEAARLMPAITTESLYGAVWMPGDGHLDPHTATHALAAAARKLGARVNTNRRVTGISMSGSSAVESVNTDAGPIETDVVVVAGGIWGPQIAAMAGAFAVSTPVDHQHAALLAVRGHEVPHDMPCFRDPDNLIYGKAEAGGIVLGGYEANPVARWIDGVPWDHAGTSLAPDQARFEPLLAGAARRFPFLHDAGIVKLVCHPDAMTPDSNPLVGPVPGVTGLYMAAGLSLNGFGGAGGIGRCLAELITGGETDLDLYPYRPWRFGPVHRDFRYAAELAREAYKYYYYLRYPLDSDEWGRPKRTSALHTRMQDLGAVFGVKHGWERPDYFQPGKPWRRAGADQRGFGFTRPPYFDRLAEEHRAFRERVGIIDMSSFGKVELTVIGLWGPDARDVMQRVTVGDVSDSAFPFMTAQPLRIANTNLLAQRVTYVGELGWELYVDPARAGQVWDRLLDAGREFGITPGGYRVLDSLRMEKGYRYYGTDMGPLDTPFEAGLGFCVHRDKWPAVERKVTRRLRTLAVGDELYIPIYGGEAVLSEGHVVGRLRSCAYGFTVNKNLAYTYLPVDLKPGAEVHVEVFGELVPATVMRDAVLAKEHASQQAS